MMDFLAAFGESRAHGKTTSESWHTYPDGLADWAIAMQDELTMARMEISPEDYR